MGISIKVPRRVDSNQGHGVWHHWHSKTPPKITNFGPWILEFQNFQLWNTIKLHVYVFDTFKYKQQQNFKIWNHNVVAVGVGFLESYLQARNSQKQRYFYHFWDFAIVWNFKVKFHFSKCKIFTSVGAECKGGQVFRKDKNPIARWNRSRSRAHTLWKWDVFRLNGLYRRVFSEQFSFYSISLFTKT